MELPHSNFCHGAVDYIFRRISEADLSAAAATLRAAFVMWAHLGISPSDPQIVADFLRCDGYVATHDGSLCATICLRDAHVQANGTEISVQRGQRTDRATLYNPRKTEELLQQRILYAYAFAVPPSSAHQGLGNALAQHVGTQAASAGYDGIMLETGKETGWLVAWYQRLGLSVIGEGNLAGTSQQTVMLYKSLR